jgi:site-specific DNA-methyltransferase (adenine-specific)
MDMMTYEKYLLWCEKWLTKAYNILADDGRICINVPLTISPKHLNQSGEDHNNYSISADYIPICKKIGFKYWRTIIWVKMVSNGSTIWGSWRSASSPFMRDSSEAILVFGKSGWKRMTKGTSTISKLEFMTYTKNTWVMNPETKSKHPAAFPFELPKRCIQLFSYKTDVVGDIFMGSGTSGDAAVRLGRSFIGVEISGDYFSQAKERISVAELQTSLVQKFIPLDENEVDNIW